MNAPWYVDTSLSYDEPDLDRFFETGRTIVEEAIKESPIEIKTGTALEIGSGLGRVCLALAERFDNVIGLDIAPEMVKRAQEVAPSPKIRYEVGDGHSLQPVGNGTIDLVLTFTVFQHIPDRRVIQSYIEEAGRVLRPGGAFVFQWNNTPGSFRWRIWRRVAGLAQATGLRRERFGRHAPEFLGERVPMRHVKSALDRGGLKLLKTKGEGTLYAWAWAERT
jgi:SAM-dependent methyltransferase